MKSPGSTTSATSHTASHTGRREGRPITKSDQQVTHGRGSKIMPMVTDNVIEDVF